MTNGKEIMTTDIAIHGCEQSLKLTIPPLSVCYYRLKEKKEKPKKEAKDKKAPKKVPKKVPKKLPKVFGKKEQE